MTLPINENTDLSAKIEWAIARNLAQREEQGMQLTPVILEQEIRRDYLGISSISTPPCALYYSLTGAPREETDISSRFGFDTGHILEEYVLDLLSVKNRQGELIYSYTLAPHGQIKGHYDGLMILDGERCVVEIKATGGYSFAKKQEEGPDMGHIEQAFCYAVQANAMSFVVIYCNREAKKSTAFYSIHGYDISDIAIAKKAMYNLFTERFYPALSGLVSETRPTPPDSPKYEYGPRGWRCRPDSSYFTKGGKEKFTVGYCPYRPICPEAQEYLKAEEEKND